MIYTSRETDTPEATAPAEHPALSRIRSLPSVADLQLDPDYAALPPDKQHAAVDAWQTDAQDAVNGLLKTGLVPREHLETLTDQYLSQIAEGHARVDAQELPKTPEQQISDLRTSNQRLAGIKDEQIPRYQQSYSQFYDLATEYGPEEMLNMVSQIPEAKIRPGKADNLVGTSWARLAKEAADAQKGNTLGAADDTFSAAFAHAASWVPGLHKIMADGAIDPIPSDDFDPANENHLAMQRVLQDIKLHGYARNNPWSQGLSAGAGTIASFAVPGRFAKGAMMLPSALRAWVTGTKIAGLGKTANIIGDILGMAAIARAENLDVGKTEFKDTAKTTLAIAASMAAGHVASAGVFKLFGKRLLAGWRFNPVVRPLVATVAGGASFEGMDIGGKAIEAGKELSQGKTLLNALADSYLGKPEFHDGKTERPGFDTRQMAINLALGIAPTLGNHAIARQYFNGLAYAHVYTQEAAKVATKEKWTPEQVKTDRTDLAKAFGATSERDVTDFYSDLDDFGKYWESIEAATKYAKAETDAMQRAARYRADGFPETADALEAQAAAFRKAGADMAKVEPEAKPATEKPPAEPAPAEAPSVAPASETSAEPATPPSPAPEAETKTQKGGEHQDEAAKPKPVGKKPSSAKEKIGKKSLTPEQQATLDRLRALPPEQHTAMTKLRMQELESDNPPLHAPGSAKPHASPKARALDASIGVNPDTEALNTAGDELLAKQPQTMQDAVKAANEKHGLTTYGSAVEAALKNNPSKQDKLALEYLQKAMKDLGITDQPILRSWFSADTGKYYRENGAVAINPLSGDVGKAVQHELTHAVTVGVEKAFAKNPETLTVGQRMGIVEMKTAQEAAYAALPAELRATLEAAPKDYTTQHKAFMDYAGKQRNPSEVIHSLYGAALPQEWTAQVINSPEFRGFLDSVPKTPLQMARIRFEAKPQSLYDFVIGALRKMITGKDAPRVTASAAAYENALKMMLAPVKSVPTAGTAPLNSPDNSEKSDLQSLVPAIQVNGQLVQGKQGDTHMDILMRHIGDTEDSSALFKFDRPGNYNFFVDTKTGRELSRAEMMKEHGFESSQELRDAQLREKGGGDVLHSPDSVEDEWNEPTAKDVERIISKIAAVGKLSDLPDLEKLGRENIEKELKDHPNAALSEHIRRDGSETYLPAQMLNILEMRIQGMERQASDLLVDDNAIGKFFAKDLLESLGNRNAISLEDRLDAAALAFHNPVEKKQAAMKLREQAARYRQMFESVADEHNRMVGVPERFNSENPLFSPGETSPFAEPEAFRSWFDANYGKLKDWLMDPSSVPGGIQREMTASPAKDQAKKGMTYIQTKANEAREQTFNKIRHSFARPIPKDETGTQAKAREAADALDRSAAAFIVEAGGSKARMKEFRDLVAGSNNEKLAKEFTPVTDHALAAFDRLAPKLGAFREKMADNLKQLQEADIKIAEVENYITHAWDDQGLPDDAMLPNPLFGMGSGQGRSPNYITKGRTVGTLAEGINKGLKPKGGTLDIASLAGEASAAAESLLQQREFIKKFEALPSPTDGKPIFGKMEKVETIKSEWAKENGNDTPADEMRVPRGYKKMTGFGKDLIVHNDFAPMFENFFGRSGLRSGWKGRLALKVAAGLKTATLVGDVYHANRIGMRGLFADGGLGYRRGLALSEYAPEDVQTALDRGEITKDVADYHRANYEKVQELQKAGLNVGKWSDNLMEQANLHFPKWAQPLNKLNDWIFQKVSRGVGIQTALAKYERIKENNPELSKEEAARKTAIETNRYLGNIAKSDSIFQNATLRDAARIAFLAPSWMEGMALAEGQGYAQMGKGLFKLVTTGKFGGADQARVMAVGVVAMLLANQVVNYVFQHKSTFENEEDGHKLDAKIPVGKWGLWNSPFSLTNEFAKGIEGSMARRGDLASGIGHVIHNKESIGVQAIEPFFTGEDQAGRKLDGTAEKLKTVLSGFIPVPIPFSGFLQRDLRTVTGIGVNHQSGSMGRWLASLGGQKTDVGQSPISQMYAVAGDYRGDRARKDTMAGEYTDLRHALGDEDEGYALDEVRRLARGGKTLSEIREAGGIRSDGGVKHLWFISKEGDEAMLRKLDAGHRKLYAEAQKMHTRNALFLKRILAKNVKKLAPLFVKKEVAAR